MCMTATYAIRIGKVECKYDIECKYLTYNLITVTMLALSVNHLRTFYRMILNLFFSMGQDQI